MPTNPVRPHRLFPRNEPRPALCQESHRVRFLGEPLGSAKLAILAVSDRIVATSPRAAVMAALPESGRLLSPSQPPPHSETSATQRLVAWCDLMNTCEQFLLAGLRRKIGPEGDIQAAYRDWYGRQCEEKDRRLLIEHRHSSRHGARDAV